MKPIEHLNNIIQLAEDGGFDPSGLEHKSFRRGSNVISFVGHNVSKYEESLKTLYQKDKSVHDTYSLKQFESELIDFLNDSFATKKTLGANEGKPFFEKLLSEPIQEFSVLRDVYNLILNDLSKPCILGPFTIYHFPSHQNIVNSKTNIFSELLWGGESPNYLIETISKARHFEKATEKADILFEKFELSLRYTLGFTACKSVGGVLNPQEWRYRRATIFSKDGSAFTSHNNSGSSEVTIDDPYFSSTDKGFDRVWRAMASTNITELQKRLLLAIEWIGQSYNEVSPSSAFLKSVIALEILFTHNEKTIINASILSQISESIALLLGRDQNERIKIESEVKSLYSMRSAIAHAGKMQVAQEDLFRIFHLSRTVVIKLMTSSLLRDLKSISDLHEYLKSCKYSCGAI